MNGDQYILSFDLSAINRQITDLQNSYTSLTESFRKSSEESGNQLQAIESSVREISDSLDASFAKMNQFYTGLLGNLESTTAYFERLEGYSRGVTENLQRLQGVDLSNLRSAAPDDTAAERIAAISPEKSERFTMTMSISAETDEIAEDALAKAEQAIKAARKALKESEESQNLILRTHKKLADTIKKELKSGKGAMMGIARKGTMGVVGGGILAGLISMMIMGVQESQRMAAERGEMLNIFEAIGDMFSKESKKAVGWFSRFAEHAQFYFGIGRKEIQGVVKQMVDAGYESGEIMTDFSKKITDVEANVATLSIGLDKHLNQATGTSMQNMVKLVTQYGESIDTAADKYKRLTFEAQRSGMGVNKFIDSIMAGSSAMTQYGIEMEDVVEVMGKMQDYYKSMGLSDQFAGDQASQAVKGIVGGIAGLDEGTMAALAQRMFGSLGLNALEAIQMFKEGAARVAAGDDKDFLINAAKELKQMADELTGGDRATGIRFLESRGLSNQQATALFDVADKLEKGTKIEELSNEEQKALNKAFVTEGKQLTELQKTQRSLIKALTEMGKGVIKLLTSLLGAVIVGTKGLLSVVLNPTTDPEELAKRYQQFNVVMDSQVQGMSEGLNEFLEGGKKAGSVIGDVAAGVNKRLGQALEYNPGGQGLFQRIEEVSSAVKSIADNQDVWVAELQASFNARIDDIIEAVGGMTAGEREALRESDAVSLQRQHEAAYNKALKAKIPHKHTQKAMKKISESVNQ